MSKKKICFVAQFPPPMHGLSKAVETLYNSCLNSEFELEKVDITQNKYFIHNIRKIFKSKADLFYFTISQTKGGNLRDLVILKLLSIQHKKCLIHLHGGYYRTLVDSDLGSWQRRANYKAMRKVNGAIVLGQSLKWIFDGMIDPEKIYTVPNCVDDEYLMSNEEFEEKVGTLAQRSIRHILYLSNFIRSKGYREVLEMAKMEKEYCAAGNARKFHFNFAGKFFKKDEEEYFFDYVREHDLEDYVTYHGIVGGDEKCKLLKLCDIFVLLTRYPNEGQPISILEAMGNGMLIVTTHHAGIPDIVKDKVNCILFDHNSIDVAMVYKKIKEAEHELSVYERTNRDCVMENYTQTQYIKNMLTCYDMLMR